MPPENQYGPQPQQPNYDFIMNPNQQKRSGRFFNGSPKSLFIMLGAVLAFIIILFIVYQAAKPVGLGPQLTTLAQNQNEIARVAGLASQSANSQNTKNFGATVNASMTTQENQLVDMLSKSGISLSSDTLAAAKNPKTDASLTAASQASNFDPVFTKTLTEELKDYQVQLSAIFKQTKPDQPVLKQQLQNDFDSVNLMLEQAKQSSS